MPSGEALVITPGTPIPLGAGFVNSPLLIQAHVDNTGSVYVKTKGSEIGVAISATQTIRFDFVSTLENLLIDAGVAGEGVQWITLSV